MFLTTHYMEGADAVVIINGGRIVTEGAPFRLREKHSSDVLILVPKDPAAFNELLLGDSVSFDRHGDRFIIPIGRTLDSADLIQKYRDRLDPLEVRAGTLDDAFINITGGGLE